MVSARPAARRALAPPRGAANEVSLGASFQLGNFETIVNIATPASVVTKDQV